METSNFVASTMQLKGYKTPQPSRISEQMQKILFRSSGAIPPPLRSQDKICVLTPFRHRARANNGPQPTPHRGTKQSLNVQRARTSGNLNFSIFPLSHSTRPIFGLFLPARSNGNTAPAGSILEQP